MRNRQYTQRQAQINRYKVEDVENGAHNVARGVIASNAPILDKVQGLVINHKLICDLARYIAKHVQNPADVDGRVQDTLLEALQAYPDFKGESSLMTWLIGIAKHQIAHYYRKAANNGDYLGSNVNIEPNYFTQEDDEYQSTRNEELLDALSSLSRAYQELLYWHAVEGLSHADIGKKLGISENAVNHRISRARAALRRISEKKSK